MRGVNKVILIGNLGKDPDLQYLDGNIGVAKFPLATTETYKDKGGKLVSQTEWHTVVLWRGPGRTGAKIPSQRKPDLRRRQAAHQELGRQGRQ